MASASVYIIVIVCLLYLYNHIFFGDITYGRVPQLVGRDVEPVCMLCLSLVRIV